MKFPLLFPAAVILFAFFLILPSSLLAQGQPKPRAPQPELGGVMSPSPETIPKKEVLVRAPMPLIRGLEAKLQTMEEIQKDLQERQLRLKQELENTPAEDKIKQLRATTASLEVELQLEQVQSETRDLREQLASYRRDSFSAVPTTREAAASNSFSHQPPQHDERVEEHRHLQQKVEHLQAATEHLRHADMHDLAEELVRQAARFQERANRIAADIRRDQERQREMENRRAEHNHEQSQGRETGRDGGSSESQAFREEVIGAIRELNRNIRELRSEMQNMRRELDKR